MIREIRRYPDPILRKKCLPVQLPPLLKKERDWSGEKVKEITERIKNLGLDMVETMTENQGIGLAAPQVGELKRMIVVHPIQERTPEEKAKRVPQVFINPKITKKSKETIIDEEGCLSFPGLYLKIKRAKKVVIEALNQEGKKIQMKAEGLPARVFQHEIDHLDGVLFIDRLSFWQKLKIKKKLKQRAPDS